jgi:hypothetical protein
MAVPLRQPARLYDEVPDDEEQAFLPRIPGVLDRQVRQVLRRPGQ